MIKFNLPSSVALRQLAEVEHSDNMYFVYAIHNHKNNKIYIGQTKDLATRLKLHEEKLFKGFTARFDGEWKLIYKEQVSDRKEALKRERQLKSYRGREFIKTYIPR